jgi:hypothetical protein
MERWKVPGQLGPWILAASLAFSCLGLVFQLERHPGFVDFDAATIGIFVNDLTIHGRFDHAFAGSSVLLDAYRLRWAAFALPLTFPLSVAQRLTRTTPDEMSLFLRIAAVLLGALGSLCAALALGRRQEEPGVRVAFVLGLTVAFPAFLLYVRTGFPNILLPYFLFWLAVYLTVLYAETQKPLFLYVLSFVLAWAALNLYPPFALLPPALVGVLLLHRRLRATLRSRRFFLAGAVFAVAFLGASWLFGTRIARDFFAYRKYVSEFRSIRGHAVSWQHVREAPTRDRLVKWADQHLLFRRDRLGDVSRPDDLWTLGSCHGVWLLLAPLTLVGMWAGRRERETRLALAILGLSSAFFLTLAWPEGRYTIILVPCYAALVARGFEQLVRVPSTRMVGAALLLFAFAANTFFLVSGGYDRELRHQWGRLGSLRKAVREAARLPAPVSFCFPAPKTYQAGLYFRMLTAAQGSWIEEEEMKATIRRLRATPDRGESLIVVCPVDETSAREAWRAEGFRDSSEFEGDDETGRYVLMASLAADRRTR